MKMPEEGCECSGAEAGELPPWFVCVILMLLVFAPVWAVRLPLAKLLFVIFSMYVALAELLKRFIEGDPTRNLRS